MADVTPPPAPQPVAAVVAHMHGIGDLFPQVIDALNDRIGNLEEQVNAMSEIPEILEQIQQLRLQVEGLQIQNQQILEEQRQASLCSIRILNHRAAHNAPLSYPVGTDRAALNLLAPTKERAIHITSANALAALNLLGVPNPPQGDEQRRNLFLEYIGIY